MWLYVTDKNISRLFTVTHDWSEHFTWLNVSQLPCKPGEYLSDLSIFKATCAAKNIWRMINLHLVQTMLRYLSLDIIFSSKLTVFLAFHSWKTVHFLEVIKSVDKYPSSHAKSRLLYIYLQPIGTSRCNIYINCHSIHFFLLFH